MRTIRSAILVLLCSLVVCCPVAFAAEQPPAQQADTLIPFYVHKGANLTHIARDYCHNPNDWKIIAQTNQLKSPYLIYQDSYLRIPLRILVIEKLQATVASVQGEVHLLADGKEPVPLKEGEFLLPGQTITTGANGRAHLVLPNSAYTRVGANSHLTLVSLFKLKNGALKMDFELARGEIFHQLLKKLRRNEQFLTETPVTITGIRGTEYRLKTTGPDTNIVETLSGQVAVSGQNNTGAMQMLRPGQGVRVTRAHGPERPRPLPAPPAAPELQPLYRTLPILITAPAHPRAKTIHFRITSDEQGLATVFDQHVAPGETLQVNNLDDGRFYAFASAIDADLFEGAAVGPLPFKLRTLPAAPIVSSPQSGAALWGSRPEATWLASEQVDHYVVQLAKDKGFTQIIEEKQVKTTQYTGPETEPGVYFFRVCAVAPDGFTSEYSSTVACTMVPEPNFSASAADRRTRPALQWPAVAPGCVYDLQVARDKEFTRLVIDQKRLPSSTYVMQRELGPGKYFIRIRATGKEIQTTAWSRPQSMTIEPSIWKPLALGASVIGILLVF
ncbi:MAG: FecR domain-containing protein [Desulfobulbus sp.]|jgi:hypothetical protein